MAALAFTGCSGTRTAETAQQQMVGMSRPQVLACMGPPLARAAEGDVEVWSYSGSRGSQTLLMPGTALLATTQPTDCTVNIQLSEAAVSRVLYRANGPVLNPFRACGAVVAACTP